VGVYNGTYGHFWTATTTGTTITAGIEPNATTSLFPVLANNGLSRRWIHINRSTSTGAAAGEMFVSFDQGNWFSSTPSVTDTSNAGAYVVNNLMGGAWKVTTANGYAIGSTASHAVQVFAPNLFRPSNGNLRLLSGTGPDNTGTATPLGRHQAGTYTPSAQRVGLTTAMLTNSSGFVLGFSSADLCPESVGTLSENFDSYPTTNTPLIPFCWSRVVTGTSITAGMSTTTPVASGAVHMSQASTAPNASFILLPPLTDNLNSASSAGFRLKLKARISSAGNGLLEVGYLTGANWGAQFNPGTFVNIANVAITNTTYGSETVVNITAGIPQGARLAIANRGTSASTHFWDDVVYEAVPACVEPTAPVFSSSSTTGMQFTFTAPSTVPSDGYDVYYSTSNIAPTAGTVASAGTSASGSAGAVTGLSPNTVYYVWIRSNCGSSGTSPWSGPIAFRTQCEVFNMPWFESFETAQGTVTCWTGNFASSG
ncbi:MAG: fibronectin type III domain-containing protein, partial [Bacteroidota bacterium]